MVQNVIAGNIVDIFDEVTKEGKYNLIKKFILNTNRDISKFIDENFWTLI